MHELICLNIFTFVGNSIFHSQSGETTCGELETHSWAGSKKSSSDSFTAFRMSPWEHGHGLIPTMQWNRKLARVLPQPLVGKSRG